MRRERWDEAAEYAALVRLQPSDPGARRAWAQATFNAGDYARAAELLEPALALAPDDSPSCFSTQTSSISRGRPPAPRRCSARRKPQLDAEGVPGSGARSHTMPVTETLLDVPSQAASFH